MFSLDQESILCLPTLAKLGCKGKILKPRNSQPIKILKLLLVLPSILFRFALAFSLIFTSCCAGSGLLKYDGCSDWTCGMNPWKFGGVYQLLWLLKLCITTLLRLCLLWDQVYSNTRVPTQVNMSRHESTRAWHESTRINTSLTRVNTNQYESDTTQRESTRVNTSLTRV